MRLGEGASVFRTAPASEGCYLETCLEHVNAYLTAISVDEMIEACEDLLAKGAMGASALGAGASPPG
jgi:hypothetical protein